jgi:hypothetical protein
MDPVEYVTALYRLCLGREPDAVGLRGWLDRIHTTREPTCVLAGILESQEYRNRTRPALKTGAKRSAAVYDRGDSIYFLHIPKTAGMSITKWLTNILGESNVCPAKFWDDIYDKSANMAHYSVFHGHFGISFEKFLNRPLNTITVLRDPVSRTISHFNHVKRDTSHPMHFRARGQDLDQFVNDTANRPMIENFQSRYLTEIPINMLEITNVCDCSAKRVGRFRRLSLLMQDLTYCLDPEYIKRSAFEWIERIKVVGVTENLQDFCHRVARELGFPDSVANDIPTENVASDRLARVNISRDTRRTIERLTTTDQALYERARAYQSQ